MIEVIESPPQTYTRKRRYQLMGTDVHSSDYAIQKLQQEHRGLRGLGFTSPPPNESAGTIAYSKLVFVNDGKSNEYVTSDDKTVLQHFKYLQMFLGVSVDGKIGYGTANKAFAAIQAIPVNSRSMSHAEYWPMIEYTQGKNKVPGVIAIQADRILRVLSAGGAPIAHDEPPVGDGGGTVKPPAEDKKDAVAAKLEWYKTGVGMAGIGLAGAALLFLMFRKKPEPDYRQLTP